MNDYYDPNSGGAESLYRHPLFQFIFTSTIKDFCELNECYWILDVVGSHIPKMKKYDFLVITFDVNNERCTFAAREDTNREEVLYQFIEYTDMSVSIKLYWENETLMFPGDR